MTALALAGRALALGLSTGLFCAGFCLPLLAPVMLAEGGGTKRSARRVVIFLAGRLLAYLLFGITFGALGGVLLRLGPVRTWLLPIVYGLLGLGMIGYGVVRSMPHIGFCRTLTPRFQSDWYVAALGFLAGINICPPFLLAITTVIDIGGALRGLLFFFVFFLATTVYLLPLFFAGLASRFAAVRFAARVASVVAGSYFIYLAVRTIT